jgi:hypothetical protein
LIVVFIQDLLDANGSRNEAASAGRELLQVSVICSGTSMTLCRSLANVWKISTERNFA